MFLISAATLFLIIWGCKWLFKKSENKTIFNGVAGISKDLIFNASHLSSLYNKTKNSKDNCTDVDSNRKFHRKERKQQTSIILSNNDLPKTLCKVGLDYIKTGR
ncbi:hypothetical protein ACFLYU_05415 [Candidatus Dependentiae bacterium]